MASNRAPRLTACAPSTSFCHSAYTVASSNGCAQSDADDDVGDGPRAADEERRRRVKKGDRTADVGAYESGCDVRGVIVDVHELEEADGAGGGFDYVNYSVGHHR